LRLGEVVAMGKDYYAILGVPKGTSDENELKKGKIILVFDPDIF
jgi:DnaJ-class molecular chaperone